MRRIGAARLAVTAFALLHLTCQAILTAPEGSLLSLSANPVTIGANGGVSIITATLTEPAGTPVPDGTVVQFFTNLGDIEEQGKTNDGVARVKLVSDSRSGTAKVTAFSGLTDEISVDVKIGNAAVEQIIMRANPPRITNSNTTHVFAAVFDEDGNPMPNVPVFFSVAPNTTTGTTTEFFTTSGPVFTNNNGEAENVMRTQRDTAGTAVVKAIVPGAPASSAGELAIPIQ
jgi:hypothetical protein